MDEPHGGPSGAVATADGGAGPLSITHKGLSLALTLDEVLLMWSVHNKHRARAREEPAALRSRSGPRTAGRLLRQHALYARCSATRANPT